MSLTSNPSTPLQRPLRSWNPRPSPSSPTVGPLSNSVTSPLEIKSRKKESGFPAREAGSSWRDPGCGSRALWTVRAFRPSPHFVARICFEFRNHRCPFFRTRRVPMARAHTWWPPTNTAFGKYPANFLKANRFTGVQAYRLKHFGVNSGPNRSKARPMHAAPAERLSCFGKGWPKSANSPFCYRWNEQGVDDVS